MSAHVVKDEIAIMNPGRLAHYFQDEPEYRSRTESTAPSLFARLAGIAQRIAELPRRRAVIDELSTLSDHELADIGLSRGDLPFVFDERFAADRSATRHAIRG